MFYLPSLIGASVAVAVLWRQLFAGDGLLNQVLALFGIAGPSWISDPDYSLYTLVALSIWQFGSPMIIFLAGLRQIPKDVYEAAEIDGASRSQQFWKITLPLLTPVVFFNGVVQTIEAFKAFTPAFVISGGTGGPDRFDAVLHALPLSGGIRQLPDGLCLGAGLDPGGDHRGLHRARLPVLALLGALRWLTPRHLRSPYAGPAHEQDDAQAEQPGTGRSLLYHVLLCAASIAMLYPLLWMLASSFQAGQRYLRQRLAVAVELQPGGLPARLVRPARSRSDSSS